MKKVFVYDPTLKDKQSSVRGIGRYLQILKENFPDWVYTSNLKSKIYDPGSIFINPFFNFLQPPLILRRVAKRQIAVIHDLIPLKYPSHFPSGIKGYIYILLNKFALKNYDLIITVSEASKADIINILGIHENKIKVIYSCLPKIFTESQNSKIKSDKKTFDFSLLTSNFCIYVGDATWNKNLINMARAIKIADVFCVFVGNVFNSLTRQPVNSLTNKWQFELKEFYELTKNDKRFIFAGFVPDSELIKLYQQALFNILPSRDEGFGFSWLEGANFACPSLLSDIPVLREISTGKAIFFDPENPKNIADKIKDINSNKILRNEIGASAKKKSEYFSPEKFKKEFLSIINNQDTITKYSKQ